MTTDRITEPTRSEDLAALIHRVVRQLGTTQKAFAAKAGIPYTTLNAWTTRRRGDAGGIDPDALRAIADASDGIVTVADVFESSGRMVPGEIDVAREERLLKFYRAMTPLQQRALIEHAERISRVPSAPRMPRAE